MGSFFSKCANLVKVVVSVVVGIVVGAVVGAVTGKLEWTLLYDANTRPVNVNLELNVIL